MPKELLNWLEHEFFKSNHPKYHKYFQEWITNVTQDQIEGFEKQRIGQITQNKHILYNKTNKAIFETNAQTCDIMNDIIKKDMKEIKIDIPKGYEFFGIDDDNKIILTEKQPQYPKTYEECYKIMKIHSSYECAYNQNLLNKINNFYKLLLCRDTYWKIAGEQMGLGKPWEPDCTDDTLKYGIRTYRNKINCYYTYERNGLLLFPTEEMQNEFYKNFRELIEQCKELL